MSVTASFPIEFWGIPFISVVAIISAVVLARSVRSVAVQNESIQALTEFITNGAAAFFKRQTAVVGALVILIAAGSALGAFFGLHHVLLPFFVLAGYFWSGLAGFMGVRLSAYACAPYLEGKMAGRQGSSSIVHKAGVSNALFTVGLVIWDIWFWLVVLNLAIDHNVFGVASQLASQAGVEVWSAEVLGNAAFQKARLAEISLMLLAYCFGAATQALFGRTGGGLISKAADMSADAVESNELLLQPSDIRNPAMVADLVGDHLNNVAGTISHYYEALALAILTAVGTSVMILHHHAGEFSIGLLIMPLAVAAVGLLASMVGLVVMSRLRSRSLLTQFTAAYGTSFIVATLLLLIGDPSGLFDNYYFLILWLGYLFHGGLFLFHHYDLGAHLRKLIGVFKTDIETGSLSITFRGFSIGMRYAFLLMIITGWLIFLAFWLGRGSAHFGLGLHAIALTGITFLGFAPLHLMTNTLKAVSDQAEGEVRMLLIEGDAGNQVYAFHTETKMQSIFSRLVLVIANIMTAFALFFIFADMLRFWTARLLKDKGLDLPAHATPVDGDVVLAQNGFSFLSYAEVVITNPVFILGLLLGAGLVFLICSYLFYTASGCTAAMTANAFGQFRDNPKILDGEALPDFSSCVTSGAVKARNSMIRLSLVTLIAPLIIGVLIGPAGLTGTIAGMVVSGAIAALVFQYTGSLWDITVRHLEAEGMDVSDSDFTNCDHLGGTFRDILGPTIPIVVKTFLLSSIVFGGFIIFLSAHLGM